MENIRQCKVPMDRAEIINLMYLSTLEKLCLSTSNLKHNNVKFHGIVAGRQATSLGSITLDVTFGTADHFRTEKVKFEVVPFNSVYHESSAVRHMLHSWQGHVIYTSS